MDADKVYYNAVTIPTFTKSVPLLRMVSWDKTRPERVKKEDKDEDDGWDEFFRTFFPSTVIRTSPDNVSTALNTLLNMFNAAGIKVRVTSGLRPGATTSSGNTSFHASGEAIDIVPEDGNFAALASAIRSNQEIKSFMLQHGLGIIDETTPLMLARTGGTGAHFHIGPDRIGLDFWNL